MEPLSEAVVSQKLGISRTDLKNLRKGILREHTHFFKKMRSIWITPAGQIAIEKHLKKISKTSEEEVKTTEQEQTQELLKENTSELLAEVERLSVNKMMLICKINGKSGCRVKVKDNSKFIPKMTFRVKPMREPNLWTIDGNCPRWRGRW